MGTKAFQSTVKQEIRIAQDEISVPTYTHDIVAAALSAHSKNLTGLYHLTNAGYCSRYDWVKFFFEKKGFDNKITPASSDDFYLLAKRPKFSAMSNRKLCTDLKSQIPSWQDAVIRFAQQQKNEEKA